MALRHSLRFRIIITFTLAGFLMSIVFGITVFSLLNDIEDNILEDQIQVELQRFLEIYRQQPDTPLPKTDNLQGFIGTKDMDPEMRDWAEGLEPGFYDCFTQDHYFAIAELPDRDELFYLRYFVLPVEPVETLPTFRIITIGSLLVTFLSGWFGWFISNRMISPLLKLSKLVSESNPETEPISSEESFYNDEVGLLAQNFQQLMNRVSAFVARERRFTRDASHEFRTPVTVIKGAAELLTLKHSGLADTNPLRRIKRAVRDLENIIETFLYLGREGNVEPTEHANEVIPIVENAIHQNSYLLEEKNVHVSFKTQYPIALKAPKTVILITIGNLIRNSFQYTASGSVTIELKKDMFQITDTGCGIAPQDLEKITSREVRLGSGEGFGLGLSIVHDFCQTYGWQLYINSQLQIGTKIALCFNHQTHPSWA